MFPIIGEVVIRTNGGKLTITAEKDIVNHYNEVQTLDIAAVDLDHSYHEFGKVGYATIAKGHFVAEAKSEIKAIVNKGAKESVKIDKDSSATVVRAFTTDNSAKLTEHGGNVSLDYFEGKNEQEIQAKLEEIKHDAEAEYLAAIKVGDRYFLNMEDLCKNGQGFKRALAINGKGYVFDGNFVIEILKDIKDDGFIVATGSNLTIELNGHTWDIIGTVGSAGTTYNGCQLLKDSTVVFKNGKLTSSVSALLIQNYANLTLDNMILDGTNLPTVIGGNQRTPYTMSNNNGNIIIKDTTIIAHSSGVAFDVYNWITGGYQSIDVTVRGNSKIVGTIEVGGNGEFNSEVNTFKLSLLGGDFSESILDKQSGSSNATITIGEGVVITEKQ